jgi:serine acetyltransferase
MTSKAHNIAVISPSAVVDQSASLGKSSRVWDLAKIREGASIGSDCIIGRGVYIDHGVVVGDRCKIQNEAQLFTPAKVGHGVFIGPGAILTNDIYPRAITPEGRLQRGDDWNAVGVTVRDGASIGAGAILIGGVTVGRWGVVAAGAVVTSDVPAYSLVAGVPARRIGWVGRSGQTLITEGDHLVDPVTLDRYSEADGHLEGLS